jgi:hypothetical protein
MNTEFLGDEIDHWKGSLNKARGGFHRRLTRIKNRLLEYDQRVRYCCVYEGRRVAMFFISQNKKRIQAIQDSLRLYINDFAYI